MNKKCIDKPDPEECSKQQAEYTRKSLRKNPGYTPPPPARNEAGERWCSGYKTGGHFTAVKNFSNNRHASDGLGAVCKTCVAFARTTPDVAHAEWLRAWKRYGILDMTVEYYEKLLAEQGGHCYLCGAKPSKRRLAVDHDHTTGKARRLLCGPCNHAIERLENHNGWAARAQDYLKEFAE